MTSDAPSVVVLSGRLFVLACATLSCLVLFWGRTTPLPVGLLAAEVLATILGLFLFGSFKYQIHKNALTYGMLLVILATFCALPTSGWHQEIAQKGWASWARAHLLSFRGVDELVHADTMLFILGLTFFVSVVAQSRMLEGLTLALLRRNGGAILPTTIGVTAVVAFVSGILGGVSLIGLTIRTLVIILMLAAAPKQAILFAVMVCTAVTTVCGVWLMYGEPPNLIMKVNLEPHLGGMFFIKYCGPIAVATYLVVARHLRKRLSGQRIDVDMMDVLDANAEDVRFLQATRHGEVLTPVELVEGWTTELGEKAEGVLDRLRAGASLGTALVLEDVPLLLRQILLGYFVTEELADSLDRHYVLDVKGDDEGAMRAEQWVDDTLSASARLRRRAQFYAGLALIPFVAMLAVHAAYPKVPLFVASGAAFAVAIIGIARIPTTRALAIREARAEYAEYYFLFPLFLAITLLTQAGFFNQIEDLIQSGLENVGRYPVAWTQFVGATFLSAILDNNIVADFASRGIRNLDPSTLHLFAMSQIGGYALGGCWTHIGCAQSVVAYAFIQRDLDVHFTPVQWIREMTPVILEMLVVVTALIYIENSVLKFLR
jgi:hypothetical protein